MPADLLARVLPRLDSVYPPFRAVAFEVLARCRASGADYWATRAYSTYAEQTELWMQGRDAAHPGPVVTQALGGQSAHNFGLAFDVCRDTAPSVPKLQPGWRLEDYAPLGDACRALGLVWGGTWPHPDAPHFQWPGYVSGQQLRPLRLAYAAGGLSEAWRLLDVERARPEWAAAHPLLHAELERLGFTDKEAAA